MTAHFSKTAGILHRQFEELCERWPGAVLTARKQDGHDLIAPNVKLPAGNFNKRFASVGAIIPLGFPQASPDRFFVERALMKSHGGLLNNLRTPWDFDQAFEEIRYGHPALWDPNKDTLITVVHYVARILYGVSTIGERS